MNEYHKIQSLYKRDEKGRFIEGDWAHDAFEYLQDATWQFTEKVDGTNIRVMWKSDEVVLGGKTDNASIPAFLVKRLQDLFMPIAQKEKFREKFPDGCCLYGEGYGAKIQKGGGNYIRDGVDFVLFDVKVGCWWLEREAVIEVADLFGCKYVPEYGTGSLREMEAIVRKAPNSFWGPFPMEGLVARPLVQLFDRKGHRIITKLKVKDFADVREHQETS